MSTTPEITFTATDHATAVLDHVLARMPITPVFETARAFAAAATERPTRANLEASRAATDALSRALRPATELRDGETGQDAYERAARAMPYVFFAPTPGQRRPADPDAIYVRRPALYRRDAGDAQAIRVEAFAHGSPAAPVWNVGTERPGAFLEPIYTETVWCTRDDRARWDARTEGKVGSTGPASWYVTADAAALTDAIERARGAIAAWHETHPAPTAAPEA